MLTKTDQIAVMDSTRIAHQGLGYNYRLTDATELLIIR